jgi:hypothetical protein
VIIDPLISSGRDGGSPYLTVFAACMGAVMTHGRFWRQCRLARRPSQHSVPGT